MNNIYFANFLRIVALISVLSLFSCGGGSGVTAGASGSGIGGTGVTLVRGNVATVVAALERGGGRVRMLAGLIDVLSSPAIAESGSVFDIMVSGGGQSDATDELGRFELIGVRPSPNFVLTFAFSDGQRINLAIGSVPELVVVDVSNIVIDTQEGSATPSSIETRNNSDDGDSNEGGSGDDDSSASGSGSGGSEDDNSTEGGSGSGGSEDDDTADQSNN